MRIAITGGTGFVGRHLARAILSRGHEVCLIARGFDQRNASILELPNVRFFRADLSDVTELARAFSACGAVAHCAGINREIGGQTYQRVHVQGTQNVVEASRRAGVGKVVLLSFLRARPNCGSGYHESKWAAEEIVRRSGLDYTVLKAGVIYGLGDHMLDHLSHALFTFPIFATVGLKGTLVRPLAVEDLVHLLSSALLEGRMSRKTLPVMGPEEMPFSELVRRVAKVLGKSPIIVRMPVPFHYAFARFMELTMRTPMVSLAQVRILAEGLVEPIPPFDAIPEGLIPTTPFSYEQIRRGLPKQGPFGKKDLRCCASR